MFKRLIQKDIEEQQDNIPVIAIVGARQVGKSTLAKQLISDKKKVVFLDMELSSDRAVIKETESFLKLNKGKIICIDEIQIMPSLFTELRPFIDNNPDTKFIISGSSSPTLTQQSSESLAGRIYYYELTPFLWQEIKDRISMQRYRLIGGMPLSILAKTNKNAFVWLKNYIKTFLERDLRTFGFEIAPNNIRRLWMMLAHFNGQILNYSQLGNSMGVSHTTVKHYIDILQNTFMIRLLEPYHLNIKKRLIKSPKIYFRDTGVLHTLLKIETFDELFTHPIYGSSWEVTVIENIIFKYRDWNHYYYRSSNGNEIDLVLTKGTKVIAIEIKTSTTPNVTKGFWIALSDIKATESYIIAPVKMPYLYKNDTYVYPIEEFLEKNV
ncbi:MAG TPA: ATP-binding protein [Crocinitomix sp.]|nr:ATP-binding protein [Crocinitomix sp.]